MIPYPFACLATLSQKVVKLFLNKLFYYNEYVLLHIVKSLSVLDQTHVSTDVFVSSHSGIVTLQCFITLTTVLYSNTRD